MSNAIPHQSSIRTIALAVLFSLLTLNLTACNKNTLGKQSTLTEESLRKFYDAGLQAAAKRDAQGTCAQYADSAEIRMIKFMQMRSEKTTQSKAEFCRELEDAYGQLRAVNATSSARLDIGDITIAADGKSADVISKVTETIQIAGQGITSTSEQSDHIELIEGKPLVTQTTIRITGAS